MAWDCTCNTGCVSTYLAGTAGSVDDGTTTSEINDGTCQDDDALTEDVVEGCNVEDCGYDIDLSNDLAIDPWDCCSATCITFLTSAPGACPADETCNTGGCNFFRAAGTADIGVCCAPGNDADGVAIDCATLAGDNTCDEACNTGACNNDGGDCE